MGKVDTSREYATRAMLTGKVVCINLVTSSLIIMVFAVLQYAAGATMSPVQLFGWLSSSIGALPKDVWMAFTMIAAAVLAFRPYRRIVETASSKKIWSVPAWWTLYGVSATLTVLGAVLLIARNQLAWVVGAILLCGFLRVAVVWKSTNKVPTDASAPTTEQRPSSHNTGYMQENNIPEHTMGDVITSAGLAELVEEAKANPAPAELMDADADSTAEYVTVFEPELPEETATTNPAPIVVEDAVDDDDPLKTFLEFIGEDGDQSMDTEPDPQIVPGEVVYEPAWSPAIPDGVTPYPMLTR